MKNIEIEKIDNYIESLMLTGMIVSSKFLQEFQTLYQPDLIEMPFVRTVAGWCLDYWKQYKKAPGIHIQDIYTSHTRNGLNKDQAELIGDFLESISREHERAKKFNVDYLLSQVEIRFKEQSLSHLAEDIKTLLSEGHTQEAELLQVGYRKVERPASAGINPFADRNAIYEAFESRERDYLFTPPGELGKFLGSIERSTLTAIMGSEKKGKTWTLMQFGIWAMQARCNVAFFECGDMIQRDIIRRIYCNLTRSSDRKYGRISVPVLDCQLNQDNLCMRKERTCDSGIMQGNRKMTFEEARNYIPCTACRKDWNSEWQGAIWKRVENVPKLTWTKALEMGKKTASKLGDRGFKIATYPNGTINVQGLKVQLDLWERSEGFIPDVIIIDYADILASEDNRKEYRHQQNETWQALRALSQERCCAVFVATQADANSYSRTSIGARNFSEDKRKYGHATMFITLNQTNSEKEEGIMRIGKMFVREDNFNLNNQCVVLQCLDIGRPYLVSFMKRRNEKKEK